MKIKYMYSKNTENTFITDTNEMKIFFFIKVIGKFKQDAVKSMALISFRNLIQQIDNYIYKQHIKGDDLLRKLK